MGIREQGVYLNFGIFIFQERKQEEKKERKMKKKEERTKRKEQEKEVKEVCWKKF